MPNLKLNKRVDVGLWLFLVLGAFGWFRFIQKKAYFKHYSFFGSGPIEITPEGRATGVLGILLFLGGLAWISRRSQSDLPFSAQWYAVLGYTFFAFTLAAIVPGDIQGWPLSLLLAGPTLVVFLLIHKKPQKLDRSFIHLMLLPVVLSFPFWFKAIDAFLYQIYIRPVNPLGDELMWHWTGLMKLKEFGLHDFFFKTAAGTYFLALPVVGNWLMAFVKLEYVQAGSLLVPAMIGLMLVTFFWSTFSKLSPIGILALTGVLLFTLFDHDWVHNMLFQLWYTEGLAVLFLATFFLVMDPEVKITKDRLGDILFLVGIGLIAPHSPPPASSLFLAAVIPGYWILGRLFWTSEWRKVLYIKIAIVGGSALLSTLVYKLALKAQGVEFSKANQFDFKKDIAQFSTDVVVQIIPYLGRYPQQLLIFGISFVMAVLAGRRYWPSIGIQLGLLLSIFILYMTHWATGIEEWESAARYLVRIFYGWLFYFLVTHSKRLFPKPLPWENKFQSL